jgi:hypothetical protein
MFERMREAVQGRLVPLERTIGLGTPPGVPCAVTNPKLHLID